MAILKIGVPVDSEYRPSNDNQGGKVNHGGRVYVNKAYDPLGDQDSSVLSALMDKVSALGNRILSALSQLSQFMDEVLSGSIYAPDR